jgi:hypothetical protein
MTSFRMWSALYFVAIVFLQRIVYRSLPVLRDILHFANMFKIETWKKIRNYYGCGYSDKLSRAALCGWTLRASIQSQIANYLASVET